MEKSKSLTTTFLLFFTLINFSIGQNYGDISVTASGYDFSKKGELFFLIFESKEGFPDEISFTNRYFRSRGDNLGEGISTFGKIPYGEYAVVVYFDKNRNEKLDLNFLGFPKEPMGTSSNSKFKRLKFKKASFKFNEPVKELNIKLY